MRVRLSKENSKKFWTLVKGENGYSNKSLAKEIGFSPRAVRDWIRCKYTIPFKVFEKYIDIARKYNIEYEILEENWQIDLKKHSEKMKKLHSENKLYKLKREDRKKGYINSLKSHKRLERIGKPSFLLRKTVALPNKSTQLAELFGIVLGDGNISDYQVSISLNGESDKSYCFFVMGLIKSLFDIDPSFYTSKFDKSKSKVVEIVINSSNVVDFLIRNGLKKGNKVKKQVGIPKWIEDNSKYSLACGRGLVDTDGSVYDHFHKRKEKIYCYKTLAFTNRSKPLLNFFAELLKSLDLKPSVSKYRIYLYNKRHVKRYFSVIGTSNIKHYRRYVRNSKEGCESGQIGWS